jgi:hypothetical protein
VKKGKKVVDPQLPRTSGLMSRCMNAGAEVLLGGDQKGRSALHRPASFSRFGGEKKRNKKQK